MKKLLMVLILAMISMFARADSWLPFDTKNGVQIDVNIPAMKMVQAGNGNWFYLLPVQIHNISGPVITVVGVDINDCRQGHGTLIYTNGDGVINLSSPFAIGISNSSENRLAATACSMGRKLSR